MCKFTYLMWERVHKQHEVYIWPIQKPNVNLPNTNYIPPPLISLDAFHSYIPPTDIRACFGLFCFTLPAFCQLMWTLGPALGPQGFLDTSMLVWGLPFSMYAPRVGGWGQASYTFPLRITCKKGVGGSRWHVKLRMY